MRTTVLAAALFLAAATVQVQAQGKVSVDAAIQKIADAYQKAVLAGNAKAVASLYTEDAIEMPPHRQMVKGRAAIEQYYAQLFKEMKIGDFRLTHLEARASGDIGFDVGTYTQTMSGAGGKGTVKDSGKFTVILERVANEWKVAYAIYNSDQMPQ